MNITAIEYDDTIIVIDCGLSFPDEDMLGIDKVIPDVTYLTEHIDKVKGFVITHGHEDHIGALPYILTQVNVPVYATGMTMGLIAHKLHEAKLTKKTRTKVVKHGQCISLGQMRIEFIKTNHSIPDASAFAIYTPAGVIVHTGDFKIDYTPLFGEVINLQRFGILGKKGVLAVLCDSTNAERPGFTPSEKKVARTLENLFANHLENRMIVATFASNVDRVQQIIYIAHQFHRKVVLQGRSMLNVIEIAQKLGYIEIPDNTLIDDGEMHRYKDQSLVFITTGSQGEAMAALSRMADGTHKKIKIKPDDVVVFSSSPIPGNEKAVSKVVNALSIQGADVVFQDAHVSGHACQEEIKLVYSLLKPQYAIPVHGEYKHLMAGARLAEATGVKKENIFLLEAGSVLELSGEHAEVTGKVTARGILVDGLGVGDIGNIVMRDRQNMSENGIIIVVMSFDKESNQFLKKPNIVTRGFVYVRESGELMDEMQKVVLAVMNKQEYRLASNTGRLKGEISKTLRDFLWNKIKREPIIIPFIMDVHK